MKNPTCLFVLTTGEKIFADGHYNLDKFRTAVEGVSGQWLTVQVAKKSGELYSLNLSVDKIVYWRNV